MESQAAIQVDLAKAVAETTIRSAIGRVMRARMFSAGEPRQCWMAWMLGFKESW
jgi:hypothetical protein